MGGSVHHAGAGDEKRCKRLNAGTFSQIRRPSASSNRVKTVVERFDSCLLTFTLPKDMQLSVGMYEEHPNYQILDDALSPSLYDALR